MRSHKRDGAYALGLGLCLVAASVVYSVWWLYQPPGRTGMFLVRLVFELNAIKFGIEFAAAIVAGWIGHRACSRIANVPLRLAVLTLLASAVAVLLASLGQSLSYGGLELLRDAVNGYVFAVGIPLLVIVALWSILFETAFKQ